MRATVSTRKKARFLDAYRRIGTITGAAEAVKIHRATVYTWQKADPVFAEALAAVDAAIADDLEAEAMRRAKDGSDTLLIFLLKGLKPERYRERVHTEVQATVSWADLARQAQGRGADD